jgi:hypothetical protein
MALEYWKTLKTDEGAHFDKVVTLDAADLPPIVTWGTSPEDVAADRGRPCRTRRFRGWQARPRNGGRWTTWV